MKITFISDTHTKHKSLTSILPGGDMLIHAGDISSMGYKHEIRDFMEWFNSLDNYTHKIFIAGNHDWGFQENPKMCKELLQTYNKVTYLQDRLEVIGEDYETAVKVYGSPWQPEFFDWAFNLPRMGWELEQKWNDIPEETDILITHGPSWGNLDTVMGKSIPLGCEHLNERIKVLKPKIHVCGHIHSGYGYKFDGDTHYFNASILDERYNATHKPINVEWDPETNEITFVD
jgi:Icc-related predicted phosphoesterase